MTESVIVRALRDHVYDGIPRPKGRRYSMLARDVRLLSLIGHVTAIVKRKTVESEAPAAQIDVQIITPTRRRKYKRRDMESE